jgi:GHH signature containing HNH/Endo VII superfamily nuclease toxin  2
MMKGIDNYSESNALCVCLEGASQHVGSHGENHAAIDHVAGKMGVKDKPCTLGKYNKVCAVAVAEQCECSDKCIQDQLDQKYAGQLDKPVEHWQSNSKALSDPLKSKLENAFDALPKSSMP